MLFYIKRKIKNVLNYIAVKRLCRKNHIKSESSKISTKANYAKGVIIGENVIIDKEVSIGDYTYINQNSSVENAVIGKYCSISEGVKINPINHNLSLITTHPVAGNNGHYNQSNKPVKIGNDVLISLNSIILEGVTIGNGAVVGAGAVVTKDIPPYAVAVGVPAKVVKYRFEEQKINMLQELCWWDWPEDKIKRNINFLRGETEEIVC